MGQLLLHGSISVQLKLLDWWPHIFLTNILLWSEVHYCLNNFNFPRSWKNKQAAKQAQIMTFPAPPCLIVGNETFVVMFCFCQARHCGWWPNISVVCTDANLQMYVFWREGLFPSHPSMKAMLIQAHVFFPFISLSSKQSDLGLNFLCLIPDC